MIEDIEDKKQRLIELRSQYPAQAQRLDDWYDVELTYTSNAIEGNTLTRQETAIVVEDGLGIKGKPLKDINEAKDHHDAMKFMRAQIGEGRAINEAFILDLHKQITRSTLGDEAGLYSPHQRRVTGSNFVFPNPVKVPTLMETFGNELSSQDATPESAYDAHLRLVSIHPFSDGNGRTGRMLMNAILMDADLPPVNILPEVRQDYIETIRVFQETGDHEPFHAFMNEHLEKTLDDSLDFMEHQFPGHDSKNDHDEPER